MVIIAQIVKSGGVRVRPFPLSSVLLHLKPITVLGATHVIFVFIGVGEWNLGGLPSLLIAMQKGRLHVHHNRILSVSWSVIEFIVGLACAKRSQIVLIGAVLILPD